MKQVTVPGINADKDRMGAGQRHYDEEPTECPICHVTIIAENLNTGFASPKWLELFFRCTNRNCSRSFIALYDYDRPLGPGNPSPCYKLNCCFPVEPMLKPISADIAALSPTFVKIYAQAQSAEDHGLDEIAGPGFRKALEFLIKDYAISLATTPEAIAEIKRIMLQPVIKKYLGGDKLPIVSSRAAWLGNDETHYERRWVGKDLADLKKLISAIEHFIAMETLVANLPTEMPDPNAPPPSAPPKP
jgi:hypothetical protein